MNVVYLLMCTRTEPPDLSLDPELAPDSSGNDQEWVFSKMREDVACVVAAQAAFQRAGICLFVVERSRDSSIKCLMAGVKDKPMVTIANLVLNICRNYVSRVCAQWAAEVSLLYLHLHRHVRGMCLSSSLF